jgi:hypothetical protein
MGSLSKVKALFGFTSPRTIEKIIPEIGILVDNFSGEKWSGNKELQCEFYDTLFNSEHYQGESYSNDPDLAARDRITRAPKAFGFVDLKPEIKLTEAGKVLLSGKRVDETFTRQMLKFQLPSPYHTQSKSLDFNVKPYLELLRLIPAVDSLSKTEIALFFSQLTHHNKFDTIVAKILKFRKDAKAFRGSRKMYVFECFVHEVNDIFSDEIEKKEFKTRQSSDVSFKKFVRTKSGNMKDYADAFYRYIRATELVTIQPKTYRLVISKEKREEVDFILSTISREANKFGNIEEFKKFLFNPYSIQLLSDDKEQLINKIQKLGLEGFDQEVDIESLKDAFDELKISIKEKNIEEKVKELKSHDELPDILSVFEQIKNKEVPDAPLFLEWNVWRALVMLNYAERVDGNFIMDIDGMPLNYAPGNKPDIESEYSDFGIITEVTMSRGNTQYKMEGEPVLRHFGNAKERMNKETYCIFIAPVISQGTLAHYYGHNRMFTKFYGGRPKIIPLTLDQFITFLKVGIEKKFDDPSKLKAWLEAQWENNQNMEDEDVWSASINDNILSWAS